VRYAFNQFRRPGVVEGGPERDVIAFHRTLPGYAPTPLHDPASLAADLGLAHVLVKDESRRFGLKAFKALGASWAIHRVLEERRAAGQEAPATVSTATDGNHGRAVAWGARRLGLQAVVFIPAHSARARKDAIAAEGARVVEVEGGYDDAVRCCADQASAHGWQVIADTGYEGYLEIPRLVAQGYATLFQEIDVQIEERFLPQPDIVLVQAGVGALAAAAVDHYGRWRAAPTASNPRGAPRLVVVEPDAADGLLESILSDDGQPRPARGDQRSIMAGLNCGLPSLAAWPVLRRGVDLFLSIEDRHTEDAMRHLLSAAEGPIEAGESGAAGLGGLLALRREPALIEAALRLGLGPATTALVINTEGATDPEGFRRVTGADPLS
jgi:diaminopropionate ammonia-lyase